MLEPFRSLFSLRWTNEPYFAPLPEAIIRTFIPISSDDNELKKLELLVCRPQLSTTAISHKRTQPPPPILFLHGGFGSAAMYTDFMTYLSTRYDAPTYALSLRGHGASYSLSYFRMVYLTGLHELASDLALAVKYILNQSDNEGLGTSDSKPQQSSLIILGHSSGGGLLQYSLAKEYIPSRVVSGIILLDAIPNFGNISVYSNWAKHDPWFSLRMSLVHFNHVASPLSSGQLVVGAFFGNEFRTRISNGDGKMLADFRKLMMPYESLMWPLAMMKGWWNWLCGRGGSWIDAKDVLSRLGNHGVSNDNSNIARNRNSSRHREKVCVIVGSEDVLMDIPNQRRMVEQYRIGIQELLKAKKVDWDIESFPDTSEQRIQTAVQGLDIDVDYGVRFVVVIGAGHHVQNDVMWEKAAEQVWKFALHV